jgi:imidazolonepropionase-like amidohydrolase
MAWTFSGVFLDGFAGERVVAGLGDPEELPGRFALAGLVDAHAHPTVAVDGHGPYLADSEYGAARLAEYAAKGVTVIRDTGGLSQVTLGFARTAAAGHPVVTAAGRFLAPADRYFPRMHSPVEPDELAAAIQAEVAAGAAWVKIIGDFPQWGEDGPVPQSVAATYDVGTLREAVDAAHAAGARVAVHSNLADSQLAAIGADSIEHGRALGHSELAELGARGGAWTPTLCAMLANRDSPDPEVRKPVSELRERLRDSLPYAVAHGVRVLAGTDVVGTIADEITLLAGHGLTAGQAIAAAGSLARDFLGIHPEGDIVTYDDDPREDPGVLARPAAVVVRGVRVRLFPRTGENELALGDPRGQALLGVADVGLHDDQGPALVQWPGHRLDVAVAHGAQEVGLRLDGGGARRFGRQVQEGAGAASAVGQRHHRSPVQRAAGRAQSWRPRQPGTDLLRLVSQPLDAQGRGERHQRAQCLRRIGGHEVSLGPGCAAVRVRADLVL